MHSDLTKLVDSHKQSNEQLTDRLNQLMNYSEASYSDIIREVRRIDPNPPKFKFCMFIVLLLRIFK